MFTTSLQSRQSALGRAQVQLLTSVLVLASAFWLTPAAAQPEALRVLLGPMADAASAGAAPAGASSGASAPGAAASAAMAGQRSQVTVRRGENLTRIIRRTQPETPYKDDFLRRAFVQINPTALAGGPHRLAAGAVLQVPTALDLRLMAEGSGPGASLAAGQGQAMASRTAEEERRKWVRFP